jgi:hypothetical protein
MNRVAKVLVGLSTAGGLWAVSLVGCKTNDVGPVFDSGGSNHFPPVVSTVPVSASPRTLPSSLPSPAPVTWSRLPGATDNGSQQIAYTPTAKPVPQVLPPVISTSPTLPTSLPASLPPSLPQQAASPPVTGTTDSGPRLDVVSVSAPRQAAAPVIETTSAKHVTTTPVGSTVAAEGPDILVKATHDVTPPAPKATAGDSALVASNVNPSAPSRPRPLPSSLPAESMTTATASDLSPPGDSEKSGKVAPAVYLVGTKRIKLNYQVEGVGENGSYSVELWCTQNTRDWQKPEAPPQRRGPYVVEVDQEGLYGFTLVGKNSLGGGGREPPRPGELPQIWVVVDLTKPVVKITGARIELAGQDSRLQVTWKASDKNMGRRPITLLYAEHAGGPWLPLAANLDNSGSYAAKLPTSMPSRFLVRVEAIDQAGNVGADQLAEPVYHDLSRPRVSIVGVE